MQQIEKQYYSRIEPVLGQGLVGKLVACAGLDACSPLVEMLAGCRLHRLAWVEPVKEGEQARQLEQTLRHHNHLEQRWEFKGFSPEQVPDLLLVGGRVRTMLEGLELAEALQIPALFFGALPPAFRCKAFTLVCRPGMNLEKERRFLESLPEVEALPEMEALTLVAAVAKALLLKGTAYSRQDYDYLFDELGRNLLLMGNEEWPWQVRFTRPDEKVKSLENSEVVVTPSVVPLQLKSKRVAIFGCGGLGSLIAKEFSRNGVEHFSLVDGGKVNIFHPVRQFFHSWQVGQAKVYALAENLLESGVTYHHLPAATGQPRLYQGSKTIAAYKLKLKDNWLDSLAKLVKGIKPDLVVVATGTDLDYYLAQALQRAGYPYLVARCYPRARYFEIIFCLPDEPLPCFDCLRGHLYLGPQASLTEEEQARYEPARAITLEAEPATLVETYRAAAVTSQIGLQMLRAERAGWFQALVGEGQNCLIGANQTEQTAEGWAYGLRLPGQIAAFGQQQLFSLTTQPHQCRTCGRLNQAVFTANLKQTATVSLV